MSNEQDDVLSQLFAMPVPDPQERARVARVTRALRNARVRQRLPAAGILAAMVCVAVVSAPFLADVLTTIADSAITSPADVLSQIT